MALKAFYLTLLEHQPAGVFVVIILVHGDTSTTFAGALAAFYNQVDIGHVEAGLRTYDKYSPYPEEMNRQMVSCLADLHFAPTQLSAENLLKEGKNKDKIFITGNTAIDAMKTTVSNDYKNEVFQIGVKHRFNLRYFRSGRCACLFFDCD